jgi:hypothetical protein
VFALSDGRLRPCGTYPNKRGNSVAVDDKAVISKALYQANTRFNVSGLAIYRRFPNSAVDSMEEAKLLFVSRTFCSPDPM